MKKHRALLAYMLTLAVFTAYVVMDTFVITRVYSEASGEGKAASMQAEQNTDNTYQSGSDSGRADEEARIGDNT